jgi:hypothetical protein
LKGGPRSIKSTKSKCKSEKPRPIKAKTKINCHIKLPLDDSTLIQIEPLLSKMGKKKMKKHQKPKKKVKRAYSYVKSKVASLINGSPIKKKQIRLKNSNKSSKPLKIKHSKSYKKPKSIPKPNRPTYSRLKSIKKPTPTNSSFMNPSFLTDYPRFPSQTKSVKTSKLTSITSKIPARKQQEWVKRNSRPRKLKMGGEYERYEEVIIKNKSERMDVIDHSFDISKISKNERWAKKQREKLKSRKLKKKEEELVRLYEQERKLEVNTEENSINHESDDGSACMFVSYF